MRLHVLWLVAAACCYGLEVAEFASAAAQPAAKAPIVLHYRETPIFRGPHEHLVSAIAFAPDGQTVATGSSDGYLRLWDTASGRLKSIHGDDATRGINGLAYSPDGRFLAVVGAIFGDDVVIWDVESGRIARRFKQQVASAEAATAAAEGNAMIYKGQPITFRVLNAVMFSTDGAVVVTASDRVVLRDAQTGTIVATLQPPAQRVKALALSADGKTLVTADDDQKVRLWNVSAGVTETTLEGPSQPLGSVAISADGRFVVASCSGNRSALNPNPTGEVWSWELPAGKVRKTELGTAARQVAFATPTTIIFAAGSELWSLDLSNDSAQPRSLRSHSEDVLSVAVSPDRRVVASGSADRTVDLIDLASGKVVHRLPGLNDIFASVAAADDGKRFATASIDIRLSNRRPNKSAEFSERYRQYFSGEAGASRCQPSEVRLWSSGGRLERLLPLPACQVTAIDFISGSDQLVVGGWIPEQGGMLSIWDASTGQRLRDFVCQTAEVLSITVSPDGRTLVSSDAAGNVDFWDLQSGAKQRTQKQEHAVEAVTFSPDGRLLAAGDDHRTIRIFEVTGGALVRTLNTKSRVESLAFSPDGKLLAAGTRAPGLEFWDLSAGTGSRTLKAPGDYADTEETRAGFVAFSPDGRFVVCGGHGKHIVVFDVAAQGTLHAELGGHTHPASAIAFLPDGRFVTGGEERAIRLWHPSAGKLLATWICVPADAKQDWVDEWVGFRPSGEFVGSTPLDRLAGWQSGGEVVAGQEDGFRRRVESLFTSGTSQE